MRLRAVVFAFLLLLGSVLYGDEKPSESALDRYIEEGLRNNLSLKRKLFDLEESIEALRHARRMFFPSLSLYARYTWAAGGRQMTVPVGDLLSDIYVALNQLSAGDPYPTDFEDQSLQIVPEREHETKVRFVQPLLIPATIMNLKIQSRIRDVHELELAAYRRVLTAEMKKAYFNHLKAVSLVVIYDKSLEVLEENLRVSQRLVDSGKATIDVLYRSKAEIAGIEQRITEAEKNRRITASFFNFLVGRPLQSSIEIIDLDNHPIDQDFRLEDSLADAMMRREELKLLAKNIEIQEKTIWMSRSANLPRVSAVLDYGFQGEEYSFTLDDDFWSASIVLEWDLFDSLRTPSRTRQATIAKKRLEVELEELKKQIALETEEAYQDLLVARKSIRTSQEEFSSFEKIFEIVAKKYDQGISSQMEYMEAQTKHTNSEIGRLIAQYDYFIKHAHFEAVTGMVPGGPKKIALKPKG